MTTTKASRCSHCGAFYWYHPSGFSGPFNNPRYCPDCQEAIEKALKKVPVRFEKEWAPTEDYTREQLQAHLDERSDHGRKAIVRRVMPGLYDQDRKIWQECLCEWMVDPKEPHRSYWYLCQWFPGEEAKAKVEKEVWWDVEKNAVSDQQWDEKSGPLRPYRFEPEIPGSVLP